MSTEPFDLTAPLTETELQEAELVKPISMLSVETLGRIRRSVLASFGPVLEVGTYIGGASILMSRALADRRGNSRLISVEFGGSHLTHPDIPSDDVLRDWHANVATANLTEQPQMIEGMSSSPFVLHQLAIALDGEKASVIVIDADGFPSATLVDLQHLLTDDALVIIDDYETESEKTTVRLQVDRSVAAGELEEFEVVPYGTWFGRRRGHIATYTLGLRFAGRSGVAYKERVPIRTCAEGWRFYEIDGEEFVLASPEEVLEFGDGRYAFTTNETGAFVVFAPRGNPDSLEGRMFELACR